MVDSGDETYLWDSWHVVARGFPSPPKSCDPPDLHTSKATVRHTRDADLRAAHIALTLHNSMVLMVFTPLTHPHTLYNNVV